VKKILTKNNVSKSGKRNISICVIANNEKHLEVWRRKWSRMGFHDQRCEVLVCDNLDGNKMDAYQAVRFFLNTANGKYIIITHLDSYPLIKIDTLEKRLSELDEHDPTWAVAGNAGIQQDTLRFITLGLTTSDAKLKSKFERVDCLDENLLIIKSEARLTVSHDLKGFHLYGLDLCDIARRLGRTCYVVRLKWRHDSNGTLGDEFHQSCAAMEKKMIAYREKSFWATTCTFLAFSRSRLIHAWARARAHWLMRNNEYHDQTAKGIIWRRGLQAPLFLPAYALLWLYNKLGFEKRRHRRLRCQKD
jgi:hypothetical protein